MSGNNEILAALEEITGEKLRSVFIVWSDLFVVVERMRRLHEIQKQIGFWGNRPDISTFATPEDNMIDSTMKRSFYMAISDRSIVLVDIKMSGLIEHLFFHQIIDIVVLHQSINTNLFSIIFNGTSESNSNSVSDSENKNLMGQQGHALFQCYRREELLIDLQVVVSAMIMLQTLQLHGPLLRHTSGGSLRRRQKKKRRRRKKKR